MKYLYSLLLMALICAGCAASDETSGVAVQKSIRENGILIKEVTSNSVAEKAGLRGGDVIVSYEGTMITDPSFVERDIATSPIGRVIQMTVVRHGKLMRVQLPIERKPTRVINVTHSRDRPDYSIPIVDEYVWLGTYPYPVDITDLENVIKLLPQAIQQTENPEAERPATFFTVIVR